MHIVILVIVVAALIWLLTRGGRFGRGARDQCNWRVDPRRSKGAMLRWTCRSCGVEAYSAERRGPRDCKRHLRDTRL